MPLHKNPNDSDLSACDAGRAVRGPPEGKPPASPVVAWRRRAMRALGPNETVGVRLVAVLCGILGRDLSARPSDAYLANEMAVPARSVSTAIARLAALGLIEKRSLGRRGRVITAIITDADRAQLAETEQDGVEKLAGGPRIKRNAQLAGGAPFNSPAAREHRRNRRPPYPPERRDADRKELLAEMRGGGEPPPARPEDERDFLRAIGDGDERTGRHRFLRLPKMARADWAARFSSGLSHDEFAELAGWVALYAPVEDDRDAA
jgi:hypothetical protein